MSHQSLLGQWITLFMVFESDFVWQSIILSCLLLINRKVVTIYPVFSLLFKLLLKSVDLFLQDMNPLCELSWCQLLFLIVTGAKRWTPPATGEINDVNIPHSSFLLPLRTKPCQESTWQMSVRLAVREALQCRPGTAGTVRRRRSEGTALGRCLPPAADGSGVPRREGTVELPRGPCSPSAKMSMLGLVLSKTQT